MSAAFPLAPEASVVLTANGERVAVLMCTPRDLDDLAVGYLFSRSMLTDNDRVLSVSVSPDLETISVVAPGGSLSERLGPDGAPADDRPVYPPASPSLSSQGGISMGLIQSWAVAMFEAADGYRETGGMHCAALVLPSGAPIRDGQAAVEPIRGRPAGASYFIVREDVGRHNAVDKVLGRAFMDRIHFPDACIVTSGRIAADMILKIAAARVPIVASRSIPTSCAFDIATKVGVTVIGRIGDNDPVIYTYPERILR